MGDAIQRLILKLVFLSQNKLLFIFKTILSL